MQKRRIKDRIGRSEKKLKKKLANFHRLSTTLFQSISEITLGKVDHPSIRYLSLEKYIRGIASFSSKGCESLAYLSSIVPPSIEFIVRAIFERQTISIFR